MAKNDLTVQVEQKRWRVSLSTKATADSIGTFTCPADDLFQAAAKATERYPACEIQSIVLQETPEQELAAIKGAIDWAKNGSPTLTLTGPIDVDALWSEADSTKARASGWDLMRHGDAWRVTHDADVFGADRDLASHVQLMAGLGGELEQRAIRALTVTRSPDATLFNSDRSETVNSAAPAAVTSPVLEQGEAVAVRRMRQPHGWSIDIKSSSNSRAMFVSLENGTSQELRNMAVEMELDAQRRLKRAAFILAGADVLQQAEAEAEQSPTSEM